MGGEDDRKVERSSTARAALEEADELVDGLGRGLDPRIRAAVAGLRAHGVRTSGSCEGHLDHGLAFPWIELPDEQMPQVLELAREAELHSFGASLHPTVHEDGDYPRLLPLAAAHLDSAALRALRLSERVGVPFDGATEQEVGRLLLGPLLEHYQSEIERFGAWLLDRLD